MVSATLYGVTLTTSLTIMPLERYLDQFDGSNRVTLVGPLYQGNGILEEPLILVDGGANYRQGSAGFAVGDGDSYHGKLDQYLDPEKDHSDLAYALSRLPDRITEVILLGFLGARQDHELFNLGEVHHFLSSVKRQTRVQFDHSVTAYSRGEWSFEVHQIFSLAVLESTLVKLVGQCKYPIIDRTRLGPLKSLGLSNQGFGKVTLVTEGPAFILKPEYNRILPE